MSSAPIRVRFAPSPTGYLHVGGARTALFNFLFARKMKGTFVLRVEDTDQARSTEDSLKSILRDLSWLGLNPDEGVTLNGETGSFGPYRQSQRLSIYQDLAQKLLAEGKAYYCFLEGKATDDENFMLENSPFRDLDRTEALARVKQGEPASIRLKTPTEAKDYVLYDLVRGKVVFNSATVKDFVLVRSSGMPTYNFAAAVDDHLMKISHVIRAEEHLNNTAKQLMILEALGADAPKYAHISLILGEDKQKLSKRHGATSVGQFKDSGFLAPALVNFLALLGWSSPKKEQELIDFAELQELFSLKRINPAPAVFDQTKLRWMNSVYLRALSDADLQAALNPFLDGKNFTLPTTADWWKQSLTLLKPTASTSQELADAYRILTAYDPELTEAGKDVLSWSGTKTVLAAWGDLLSRTEILDGETFEAHLTAIKTTTGIGGKELFWPLRVALIGDAHGPDIRALVQLISPTEILRRVRRLL